ncbi:MAG: serine hydrolase domain-containing protein [Pseudomonadota bacterium]
MRDARESLRYWAGVHGVPGAQLAIVSDDSVSLHCHGLANSETRLKVHPSTRFQIGSVTKPMVAFTAFRLAEAGAIDLDAAPITVLETLPPDAPLASDNLTIQHLMDHSSGLPGDLFLDLGDDRNAGARLIETTGDILPLHRVGAEASYCNFAYVALGEIISAVAGVHWSEALRLHVVGLLNSPTLDPWPGEASDGLAVGHDDGQPAKRSHLAISNAAAGTTPIGTARDLAEFGQLLLKALEGSGAISTESARAMTQLSSRLAPNERGLGFGQGFMVMDWAGRPVFGHDGLTIGQRAFLRVFPETGLSIGLLGNGGDLRGLYQDVFSDLAEMTGASPAPRLHATMGQDFNPGLCGRYDRPNASLVVSIEMDAPHLMILNHEPWAEHAYGAVEGPFLMRPCGSETWMIAPEASSVPLTVSFGANAAWHGMRRYNFVGRETTSES